MDSNIVGERVENGLQLEKLSTNQRRFYHTFVEVVGENWINERRGRKIVIFALGSGASNVETGALSCLFPQSDRIAVDLNPTGGLMARHFGFKFRNTSADDESLYSVFDPIELVVIRNPDPRDIKEGGLWERVLGLVWKKLNKGGILYITTSSEYERDVISLMLTRALGKEKIEIENSWRTNNNPLDPPDFSDKYVLAIQKME